MQFTTRKRRQPPAIIIISLIDILIVLLIFMMLTTTFKQQPAIKLVLPESKLSKQGSTEESFIVTINKEKPYFYIGRLPVTLDKLQSELAASLKQNPQLTLAIRSDEGSQLKQLVEVLDVAGTVGLSSKSISIFTQKPGQL
ncbi:MAG: hypothetical protein FJ403_16960 [Verrucomicrobia bacterium]|nr:hypothetical protein [Verrucomicrobiota bacterium]